MSEKHTPESNEALRQLRRVIPFRVALECKHQEPVGNLRVILESAERAAEEVGYLLAQRDELLAALREAENALADYIPTIEKTGAALNYGHAVLRQARAAIRRATGEKR